MPCDGVPVRRELLAQANRRGILQVRPPRLHDMVELLPLREEGLGQLIERRQQLRQRAERPEAHRRRNDVIGRLRHVDVVVRVHRRVGAAGRAEDLVGAIREHFVAVHVVRGAGAGLIRIDDELVAMLAGKDFIGGLDDRVRIRRFEAAGVLVDDGGGALDHHHRFDEAGEGAQSGDGVVLDGTKGLDPVEGVGGDLLFAEGVLFGAE